MNITEVNIATLKENEVFVFGSTVLVFDYYNRKIRSGYAGKNTI